MAFAAKASVKKAVSVSKASLTHLKDAARILNIPISGELEENAWALHLKMWELAQEHKENAAERKLQEEIQKLEIEKAELAVKLAEKGVIEPDAAEVVEVSETQRRAIELRGEVKGMKKKLPKRAPTEWSAFKHENAGKKLSPGDMSELYKVTGKEARQEILGRYKEYLAAQEESD